MSPEQAGVRGVSLTSNCRLESAFQEAAGRAPTLPAEGLARCAHTRPPAPTLQPGCLGRKPSSATSWPCGPGLAVSHLWASPVLVANARPMDAWYLEACEKWGQGGGGVSLIVLSHTVTTTSETPLSTRTAHAATTCHRLQRPQHVTGACPRFSAGDVSLAWNASPLPEIMQLLPLGEKPVDK